MNKFERQNSIKKKHDGILKMTKDERITHNFLGKTVYLMESEGFYIWSNGTPIDSKWKYVYKGGKIPPGYDDLKIINEY